MRAAVMTAAYALTRRGGTMVMVAIQAAGEFSWTPFDAVRNEKRVLGCWGMGRPRCAATSRA